LEIIADNLSKAGWSWGCVSAVDSNGRTIFIADAHRDDGKRFVVRADETLTAFIELASRSAPSVPSLQQFGITHPLPDPRLELRNANGVAPRIKRQLAERRKRGCADYQLRTSSA
jgi:hypothetical protein